MLEAARGGATAASGRHGIHRTGQDIPKGDCAEVKVSTFIAVNDLRMGQNGLAAEELNAKTGIADPDVRNGQGCPEVQGNTGVVAEEGVRADLLANAMVITGG